MDVITITHSESGATAKIHPFGATVISFIPSTSQKEVLFVSEIAKLDGSKAIRGGIPLVFPQFGRPDESMPQHGFLRTNLWSVDESTRFDSPESGAGITLTLPLSQAVNSRGGKWDKETTKYNCLVSFQVTVTASSLVTTLTIQNTGSTEFDFQALQHTYLKVENALDPATCHVTGLEGYDCDDKISGQQYKLSNEPIIIDGNVDRVYSTKSKKDLHALVKTGVESSVEVKATGTVNGEPVHISGVVWNPFEQKAKEMSDFGNEQYTEMICVEPGMLVNIPPVTKEAVFVQTLTAL